MFAFYPLSEVKRYTKVMVRYIPWFWSDGLVCFQLNTVFVWYTYRYNFILCTNLFWFLFIWTSPVNSCPSVKLIGLQTPVDRSRGHGPCANNLTDITSRFSIQILSFCGLLWDCELKVTLGSTTDGSELHPLDYWKIVNSLWCVMKCVSGHEQHVWVSCCHPWLLIWRALGCPVLWCDHRLGK